jgi:hypothetical protein
VISVDHVKTRNRAQRKYHLAKTIAERDGVTEGEVCLISAVEPCMSFQVRKHEDPIALAPAQLPVLLLELLDPGRLRRGHPRGISMSHWRAWTHSPVESSSPPSWTRSPRNP